MGSRVLAEKACSGLSRTRREACSGLRSALRMPWKNRHASPLIVLVALLMPPVLYGTAAMDEGVEEATPSGPERACDSHKHVGHE